MCRHARKEINNNPVTNRRTVSVMSDFRLALAGVVSASPMQLAADPYTVFLANLGLTGNEYVYPPHYVTEEMITPGLDPDNDFDDYLYDDYLYIGTPKWTAYAYYNVIATAFGTTTSAVYCNEENPNISITDYNSLIANFGTLFDQNPNGVIIGSRGHKVVVTKETDAYGVAQYYVYDPRTGDISKSFRQPLESYFQRTDTISYSSLIICRTVTPINS